LGKRGSISSIMVSVYFSCFVRLVQSLLLEPLLRTGNFSGRPCRPTDWQNRGCGTEQSPRQCVCVLANSLSPLSGWNPKIFGQLSLQTKACKESPGRTTS
jgi:hypothetical protein